MALINVNIANDIAIVTLDNPSKGYLNGAQVELISTSLDSLSTDDAVKVVVFIGGVPGVFIRHYDVSEISELAEGLKSSGLDEASIREAARADNSISRMYDKLDHFPKPTIAAINGFCQGGGLEFALCCDFRICESGDFKLGLPETNIGIFPGAGGTQRLPRLIGEARALDMILRGKTISPDQALTIGLVNECVTPGRALDVALELAQELAQKPTRALREAKALIKSALDQPLADGCADERASFSALIATEADARDRMTAFLKEVDEEEVEKVKIDA
ncbi:MAG: enoyl-CoA hydratase/isomerase family protein [Parvibaculaceae bacterium]|nr:enoyl-CoA hydratase/isomerase family protein [Parvibaculaceae bacterium]